MYKILQILTYISIFQLIVLITILIINKGNKFNRNILIALFIVFGIFISGNLLLFISGILLYKVFHVTNLVIFLSAPLLYFYFLAKLNEKTSLKYSDAFHLIPFICILAFIIPVLFSNTGNSMPFKDYATFAMGLLFLQNLFYFIQVLTRLKNKKDISKEVPKKFYDTQANYYSAKYEISWIQKLFLMFFIIMLIETSLFISCRIFSLIEVCAIFIGFFFLVTFFLINSIVIFGLVNSSIFNDKPKYHNSLINEKMKTEFLDKLEKAIFIDKVYLNPLLTMEKLSKDLKVPRNYLSQLINENFAINFNEMVNQLRINDAKELISSSDRNTPIINIAYQVGYNSKSTFNSAFKRYTGKTPSMFILN